MSEWVETTLGEVADFQNGYPFKPAELDGTRAAVIRIKQLLDPQAEVDFTDVEVPDKFLIDDGDLIFSWSATLASVMWNRGPAVLNQHLFKVTEREGIDRRWLHYALDDAVRDLLTKSHGTTMKHVTKKVLTGHEVSIPPLAEQRRIVDVMSAMDAQIESLASEVERTEVVLAHVRSVVPAGEERRIAELVLGIDSGKSVQTSGEVPADGEARVLKLSAIQLGAFFPAEAKRLPSQVGYTGRHLVSEGDLLITRSNTPDRVGYAAIARQVPAQTFLPDLIWRVRPDVNTVTSEFLCHVLSCPEWRQRVSSSAGGTSSSMVKINKKGFGTVKVPVPAIEEQVDYVSRCASVAEKSSALRAELDRLRMFRSTLLNALLSREVEIPESYDRLLEAVS